MSFAAPHESTGRTPTVPAATVRRFGWALVTSTLLIASAAFVVYLREPGAAPSYVQQSSTLVFRKAAPDIEAALRPPAQNVLDEFVGALARGDETALRRLFPTMTRREARVLRGIRGRMGERTELAVRHLELRAATERAVTVDFALVGITANSTTLRSLPFSAVIQHAPSGWIITELR